MSTTLSSTFKHLMIHIKHLDYRWAGPVFDNHPYLKTIKRIENWLRNEHSPIAGLDRDDLDFAKSIFLSIQENRILHGGNGLYYPLIVKQHIYDDTFDEKSYYVIIGNRRLASLRAMDYKGEVPCIIANKEDTWDHSTRAAKDQYEIITNRTPFYNGLE